MEEVNTQNIASKLMSQGFIERLKNDIDFIIETDDQKKAYDLVVGIYGVMKKYRAEFRTNPGIAKQYNQILVKAKFIALPLLDNKDVLDLFVNYFNWFFRLEDYDVLKKFKYKLINIEVYEDRDRFKEEIKKAMLESNLGISKTTQLRTMKEWLNDYNVKLGIKKVDVLKKRQYLTDLKSISGINKEVFKKLYILFELYEKLKLSSLSPQGYEEDVPISLNNKLYIYKQGRLELISGQEEKNRIASGPPQTPSEKEINRLGTEKEKYGEGGLEQLVISEEVDNKKKIEDLEIMANKFKDDRIEKKAILEEIGKLRKV